MKTTRNNREKTNSLNIWKKEEKNLMQKSTMLRLAIVYLAGIVAKDAQTIFMVDRSLVCVFFFVFRFRSLSLLLARELRKWWIQHKICCRCVSLTRYETLNSSLFQQCEPRETHIECSSSFSERDEQKMQQQRWRRQRQQRTNDQLKKRARWRHGQWNRYVNKRKTSVE